MSSGGTRGCFHVRAVSHSGPGRRQTPSSRVEQLRSGPLLPGLEQLWLCILPALLSPRLLLSGSLLPAGFLCSGPGGCVWVRISLIRDPCCRLRFVMNDPVNTQARGIDGDDFLAVDEDPHRMAFSSVTISVLPPLVPCPHEAALSGDLRIAFRGCKPNNGSLS